MDNGKKTNKRKILFRYLILAACILLIASVTVISICAANDWFRVDISDTIDKGDDTEGDGTGDNTGGDNTGDNTGGEETPDDDKPTASDTSWVAPLATVNVITPYEFVQNVTLNNMWHFHTGLDLAADVGTTVVCCYDGVVESITLDDALEGNKVVVKHADGVKTSYAFIDVNSNLKVGDSVKKGDALGTVASPCGSECMIEPHVHFEVIENGESTDPDKYLDVSIK